MGMLTNYFMTKRLPYLDTPYHKNLFLSRRQIEKKFPAFIYRFCKLYKLKYKSLILPFIILLYFNLYSLKYFYHAYPKFFKVEIGLPISLIRFLKEKFFSSTSENFFSICGQEKNLIVFNNCLRTQVKTSFEKGENKMSKEVKNKKVEVIEEQEVRYIKQEDLNQKGMLYSDWITRFPEDTELCELTDDEVGSFLGRPAILLRPNESYELILDEYKFQNGKLWIKWDVRDSFLNCGIEKIDIFSERRWCLCVQEQIQRQFGRNFYNTKTLLEYMKTHGIIATYKSNDEYGYQFDYRG